MSLDGSDKLALFAYVHLFGLWLTVAAALFKYRLCTLSVALKYKNACAAAEGRKRGSRAALKNIKEE